MSYLKKICNHQTVKDIKKIYDQNNLSFTYKKFNSKSSINALIPFLKNDKKNNDEKINFILLKKIGKTDLPNRNKIFPSDLKKISKSISLY